MTDITRKLELIANLKSGDMLPDELCNGRQTDWGPLISGICAEALAEINRLRSHERASEKWLADLMPFTPSEHKTAAFRWNSCGTLTKITLTSMAHPEPAPDPWGSAFAMNTENWK